MSMYLSPLAEQVEGRVIATSFTAFYYAGDNPNTKASPEVVEKTAV